MKASWLLHLAGIVVLVVGLAVSPLRGVLVALAALMMLAALALFVSSLLTGRWASGGSAARSDRHADGRSLDGDAGRGGSHAAVGAQDETVRAAPKHAAAGSHAA